MATARVPVKPLSMENKELADENEVLVDYAKHQIFIHVNGEYYDITTSVEMILKQIEDAFKTDQEMMLEIFKSEVGSSAVGEVVIRFEDEEGNEETKTLKEILEVTNVTNQTIVTNTADINTLKTAISNLNTELENVKNREVVSAEQISFWNAKSRTFDELLTLPTSGWYPDPDTGEAPYSLTAVCSRSTANDRPLVDMIPDDDPETAKAQMKAFSTIYKVYALDGNLKFLASKAPESSINIQVKFDRQNETAPAGPSTDTTE